MEEPKKPGILRFVVVAALVSGAAYGGIRFWKTKSAAPEAVAAPSREDREVKARGVVDQYLAALRSGDSGLLLTLVEVPGVTNGPGGEITIIKDWQAMARGLTSAREWAQSPMGKLRLRDMRILWARHCSEMMNDASVRQVAGYDGWCVCVSSGSAAQLYYIVRLRGDEAKIVGFLVL